MRGALDAFPGVQSLGVSANVKPVIMPDRRMPIAMKLKVKSEPERLEKIWVIQPIDEPTPWGSRSCREL